MGLRTLGLDLGAETIKLVELAGEPGALRVVRRRLVEHQQRPDEALRALLSEVDWDGLDGAAACGRLSRRVGLPRIPDKEARAVGYRRSAGALGGATLVSIGSHGFSVLELPAQGPSRLRENSRCSQGTGNFLGQLVQRFGLTVQEASDRSAGVAEPAVLSGRCPVILKTDMTHLANAGAAPEPILAGLFDAVAENVQVLVKPAGCPPALALLGGVSRSPRIRAHFAQYATRHGLQLQPWDEDQALFSEALGCAWLAALQPQAPPPVDALIAPAADAGSLELLPPLAGALGSVLRLQAAEWPSPPPAGTVAPLVLGLDIGSTGSKAVAVDAATRRAVWEAYVYTSGDPLGAARRLVQSFVEGPWGGQPVVAVGATGSGREIVGSLAATCYGPQAVFVLNEIAAHAEGARQHDERVDTIFEIGGQDAKYIRLQAGRVVDAAMNEACSAGTGSFIEEQGRRFASVRDVEHLGQLALRADAVVDLGQHCSVFMAEIVDAAVGAGEQPERIIAGIYDAVVRNYLNRVKGRRSVGQVVFCQGMPFAADALAAAVARQTGAQVIVPPNPGTVGALGIAALAAEELAEGRQEDGVAPAAVEGLDLARFLGAEVTGRDAFVCASKVGCGEPGNRCRIERLTTRVAGARRRFTWGGACSLHEQGVRRQTLPQRAPDPFRARERLIDELLAALPEHPAGAPTLALTDEFALKSLFPLFATYLHGLGVSLKVHRGAGREQLRRGIEEANVPLCAPMQQYHGLMAEMVEGDADRVLLPMLRGLPRLSTEPRAVLCPLVQASPDLLRWDLGRPEDPRLLRPVLDVGPGGLGGQQLRQSCLDLAASLGVSEAIAERALQVARVAQERFEQRCLELGREAVAFCAREGVPPVVVLGRPYTIYNPVLNSNVPALLREQGAMPIPVDCYPVPAEVPVVEGVYWGYGQRSLRAAHALRRAPGVFGVWCSNYSCGPDSFNLHFFAHGMEGKPFAVIETDGHSGDAGTKTRVEAFLYCARQHLQAEAAGAEPSSDAAAVATPRLPEAAPPEPPSLRRLDLERAALPDIRRRDELVLIPRMGPGAEALAACLRGAGIAAEALPMPDAEALALGRRHTSGKECVPMCVTLGSLLQRLQREPSGEQQFAFFMPTAHGPCRFGVYNLLHKLVLQRLGWADRVRVWAPADDGYFRGVPAGFGVLGFVGFMGADLLLEALYDARPAERTSGAAQRIYEEASAALERQLEAAGAGDLGLPAALAEVASGRLWGITRLLQDAARRFAAVRAPGELPTVLVVGEIYVRCDPFSNDFVIDRLQREGVRVRFAPFNEWLEYVDHVNVQRQPGRGLDDWVSTQVQSIVRGRLHSAVADVLGWGPRTTVVQSVEAAAEYLGEALEGEAVLSLGGPVHEWRAGLIDAALNLGPLECMPSKIAESQLHHAAGREGLPSLTLCLNGDPVDPETLDTFVYELRQSFVRRAQRRPVPQAKPLLGRSVRKLLQVAPVRAPLGAARGLLPALLARLPGVPFSVGGGAQRQREAAAGKPASGNGPAGRPRDSRRS